MVKFSLRKLAGQANSALQLAHTQCGIVPRGAVPRQRKMDTQLLWPQP
jgi:hypothetical protein